MLRLPPPDVAETRGFFTRDEALAAGWTPRAIRTQVANGAWRQLVPGRYVESAVFTPLASDRQHALIALATGYGRSVVIRRDSAACVHNLSVARTPKVVSMRQLGDVDTADITELHDVRVTDGPCTVVECARFLPTREALVVADSALRLGTASVEQLEARVAAIPRNGKGRRAAHFVVAEADPRAESPFESISRYEFISAGLPRPELQAWVGNRRLDFLWERYRLIGEADGVGKYGRDEHEVRANIRAERERQRELEDAGYVIVRWLWDEIWFRPHVVVARVLGKLRQAGYAVS